LKKIIITLYFSLSILASKAQGDITLFSMGELFQSSYLNPATFSTYDLSIGIPGFSNAVAVQLNGFNLGNINKNVSDGYFNISNFYNDVNANTVGVKMYSQSDLFHIRKQFGRYQIGFHSSVRTNSETVLSKNFIGFLAQGNLQYAGQDINFNATNIQSTSYIETGISVAREFERFTVGGRIKMLNGLANLSTSNLDVRYNTGANSYDATTVTLGGRINSSGLPNFQDLSLQDSLLLHKIIDTLTNQNNIKPFDNLGWSIDLGATYHVSPRLKISASAIDIGFINWKNKTFNYDLNNINIVFPGFNFLQAKDSTIRQQYLDSLQNLITSTTGKNSYTTALPSRFMIGADYDLTLRDRIGLLFQMQYFINTFFPSYSFSYTRKVGTNWRITTNYSYYNSSYSNIGLGTSIKWGAFQIYAMQDDILLYFIPSNTRTVYLRFGCNLVWGEHRTRPRY